jgi:hypothetical protein
MRMAGMELMEIMCLLEREIEMFIDDGGKSLRRRRERRWIMSERWDVTRRRRRV